MQKNMETALNRGTIGIYRIYGLRFRVWAQRAGWVESDVAPRSVRFRRKALW